MARLLKTALGMAIVSLALLAGVTILPLTTAAEAQSTPVCGSLAVDTTWQRANSPYLVCNAGVTVAAGATLTVEPGVEVQVTANGSINVKGTLVADGAPTLPITITGVVKNAGSWLGVRVSGSGGVTATAHLNHVLLEFGGSDNSAGGQLYAEYGLATVANSLVRNGIRAGLSGGSQGRIVATATRFENNGGAAITLLNVSDYDLVMPNLAATGNGLNAIQITSANELKGQRSWNSTIPYVIGGALYNLAGASLTIAPGSELQFTDVGGLLIGGALQAIGQPGQPITFTGTTKAEGAWRGIRVYGSVQQPAQAQFDYTVIEYGGLAGANLHIGYGQARVTNSIIRRSSTHGIYVDSFSAGNVIQNSQIIDHAGFGIKTLDPTRPVLATNNWWGDPSGPISEAGCNNGTASRISAGVIFAPVSVDPQTPPLPLALSDTAILTVTPRRWFVPANGQSRAYFDLTLRDGNGAPLAGRKVRLLSSRGTVTDGGITDAAGKTLAYIISNAPGDADVRATLDSTSCEVATSPFVKITFTPPTTLTDLAPDAPAPYLDTSLVVQPMPVVAGVPTKLAATFTNPLAQPITLDISFEFAQSSIGLAFGPIATVTGKVIPAKGTLTVETQWLPLVAGHYCVQVQYNIVAINGQQLRQAQAAGTRQRNLNVYQGGKNSPNDKDSLQKADQAFNAVNQIPGGGTPIHKAIVGKWWGWASSTASKISQSLFGDPPRQDFRLITQPQRPPVVLVQPDAQISAARADALNAVTNSLADMLANGEAAVIAFDRAGGASEANDLTWAAVQTAAQLHYRSLYAAAALTTALALDHLVAVAAQEGVTAAPLTAAEILAYQQALTANGFSADDIAGYRALGMSAAEIEAERQAILAINPAEGAIDLVQALKDWAAAYRALGNALLSPKMFAPSFRVGGAPGQAAQIDAPTTGNTMVQIFTTTGSFVLGNPLSQTTTIDLRERRLGMPADWLVTIDPAQVTLVPGAQTTVTVTIEPSVPVPQGSTARVAIEGYAGQQLLGGVTMDVVAPAYTVFDGKSRLYLPLLRR
ncbi:MAG: hypothetical protein DYG89_32300 [Caldilinea sp. CFX5]|nr:hypothetical protein [Caldilinea sp. CFX5]